MPPFYWTGRTHDGRTVSGTIEANSKEAAVNALRAKNVTVATIAEGTAAPRSRFARIVLALALLAGATLMGMISKGARIQCTRGGAGYDCSIETTMAGVHTLYTESARGARTVSAETHYSYGKRRTRSDRLVITGEGRPLATEWLQSVMPRAEHVANQLNQAFAQQKASANAWQIEAAPAAVALIMGIVGLWILARSVR